MASKEMYLIAVEVIDTAGRSRDTTNLFLFEHPEDINKFLYRREYKYSEYVTAFMIEELMEEGRTWTPMTYIRSLDARCTVSLDFRGIEFEGTG